MPHTSLWETDSILPHRFCHTDSILPHRFCHTDSILPHKHPCVQIQEVLGHIEAGNLLPPLLILQILATNPRLKLSLVKEYMTRQLKAENACIEEDQRQIAKYEAETKAMREEVHELRTKVGFS